MEARVAFLEPGEDPEEIATATRGFSVRKVTRELPDAGRREDERADAKRLAEPLGLGGDVGRRCRSLDEEQNEADDHKDDAEQDAEISTVKMRK